MNSGHTLDELARQAGIEPRTIRSWIDQGLLAGPSRRGRGARYAADQLERLLAIKALRDLYGMSLAAARQELLTADAAKLRGYAAQASSSGNTVAASAAPSGSSALDYLRALRQVPEPSAQPDAPLASPTPSGPPAARSGVDRLAEELERLA